MRPADEVCELTIARSDGSSGEVSAEFFITAFIEGLGGRPAVEGVDWVAPESTTVSFHNGEIEKTILIVMPNTSVTPVEIDGTEEKKEKPTVDQTNIGDQSAFFMVELKNPKPDGLRLSRKTVC